MKPVNEWFAKSLEVLDQTHVALQVLVPGPERIMREGGFVYRYVEQSVEQAIVQKLARINTGLKSACLLLNSGFLQEAAIIQRTVDEAQEDICYLAYGKITGNWTENHQKYLANFWLDEPVSRTGVARPKIRDYLAKFEGSAAGAPADQVVSPMKTVYGTYSGYAHCSSAHVMELFDGSGASWQLNGMRGSQFQKDQTFDLRNQFYRGLVAYACSAVLFQQPSLFQQLTRFSDDFMKSTEYLADL